MSRRDTSNLGPSVSQARVSTSLAKSIFSGTSSLGAAVSLERGFGFLANLLAARFGGAQIFGTYSLALTTANNIASYAGAGIGTTANRFSGHYRQDAPEYHGLQRALALVSIQSASMAAAILWCSAKPLASALIGNPGLTGILRLSSLSAAGIILLESLRGFLIGQRRFPVLLALSLLFGGGLLIVIPVAASRGASTMIVAQACVAGIAVCACVVRVWRFGPHPEGRTPGLLVRDIWHFGLVQLASVIGLNAAGWWTASLVARGDHSMIQMGFYAAATQLRNMIAIVPGLVAQSSYALLTDEHGIQYGGPGRVLMACTLVATVLSIALAGTAVAALPWTLGRMYGRAFQPAELAASLAVATALVHMSSTPASARLSVVSLKLSGVINGIWTVLVIGLATLLIRGTGAVQATGILLIGHTVSAVLILVALKRLGELPSGLIGLSMASWGCAALLVALAFARSTQAAYIASLSAAVLLMTPVFIWVSVRIGLKFTGASDGFVRRSIQSLYAVLDLRRAQAPGNL